MGNSDVYGFLGVSVLRVQDDPPAWEAMVWRRQPGGQPVRFNADTRDGAWRMAGEYLIAMGETQAEVELVAEPA